MRKFLFPSPSRPPRLAAVPAAAQKRPSFGLGPAPARPSSGLAAARRPSPRRCTCAPASSTAPSSGIRAPSSPGAVISRREAFGLRARRARCAAGFTLGPAGAAAAGREFASLRFQVDRLEERLRLRAPPSRDGRRSRFEGTAVTVRRGRRAGGDRRPVHLRLASAGAGEGGDRSILQLILIDLCAISAELSASAEGGFRCAKDFSTRRSPRNRSCLFSLRRSSCSTREAGVDYNRAFAGAHNDIILLNIYLRASQT